MQNITTHLALGAKNYLEQEIGEVKEEHKAAVEQSITDNFNAGAACLKEWITEAEAEGFSAEAIVDHIMSRA